MFGKVKLLVVRFYFQYELGLHPFGIGVANNRFSLYLNSFGFGIGNRVLRLSIVYFGLPRI